jgi:CRP-like cAMP-binding protein
MLAMAHRSVRRRVAHLLLFLNGDLTQEDDGTQPSCISLKKVEMAQMIGVAPETLSRTLSEFKQRGLIEISGREIILRDKPDLMTIATKRARKS